MGDDKSCIVEYCQENVSTKGFCKRHYEQQRLGKPLTPRRGPTECSVAGCGDHAGTSGFCSYHYFQDWYERDRGHLVPPEKKRVKNRDRAGNPLVCSFRYCDRPCETGGLCRGHYGQKLDGKELLPLYARKPCAAPGCDGWVSVARGGLLCRRHSALAARYGLSPEEVVELHRDQHCANPGCDSIEDLHVDHDHACCGAEAFPGSGQKSCGDCVRGWLCRACNHTLGLAKESSARLRGLADYCESPPRLRR